MNEPDRQLRLPPSGPWTGYYLYGFSGPRHHMKLGLSFTLDGGISGDGIDDIGPFTILGVFDPATNAVEWTKSYIGEHSVEYRGLYDGRSICGSWTIAPRIGGFWIWPGTMEADETMQVEVEVPVEVSTK